MTRCKSTLGASWTSTLIPHGIMTWTVDLDDNAERRGAVILLAMREGIHPPPPFAVHNNLTPGASCDSTSISSNGPSDKLTRHTDPMEDVAPDCETKPNTSKPHSKSKTGRVGPSMLANGGIVHSTAATSLTSEHDGSFEGPIDNDDSVPEVGASTSPPTEVIMTESNAIGDDPGGSVSVYKVADSYMDILDHEVHEVAATYRGEKPPPALSNAQAKTSAFRNPQSDGKCNDSLSSAIIKYNLTTTDATWADMVSPLTLSSMGERIDMSPQAAYNPNGGCRRKISSMQSSFTRLFVEETNENKDGDEGRAFRTTSTVDTNREKSYRPRIRKWPHTAATSHGHMKRN